MIQFVALKELAFRGTCNAETEQETDFFTNFFEHTLKNI